MFYITVSFLAFYFILMLIDKKVYKFPELKGKVKEKYLVRIIALIVTYLIGYLVVYLLLTKLLTVNGVILYIVQGILIAIVLFIFYPEVRS